MRPRPTIRAVVVTWEGAHLLAACLDSLLAQSVDGLEILVVDNASTDGTAELVHDHYPGVAYLHSSTNLGFAGGVALGTAGYEGDHVVLLNNDATFAPDAIAELLAVLEDPAASRVGAVTAKILLALADDSGRASSVVNSTGNAVSTTGTGFDRDWMRADGTESRDPDVFGFCGGAAMLRGSALRAVGGFDASLFLYYEDTDLSWRLRAAGWDIRYVPTAVAVHRHAASTGVDSPVFRYYNTRNSLVVFTRHAPPAVVLASAARQSLGLVRAFLAGPRAPVTGARARALRDYLVRLPRTLGERRRTWAGSAVDRAVVARYLERTPSDR